MPSTVIASMDYDAANQLLIIRFVSGLVYKYKAVPPDVFAALKSSFAKGSFLNQNIKGKYDFEKLVE